MKLLVCTVCDDIVALAHDWRNCRCCKVGGRYRPDGDTVVVAGPLLILAVSNQVFRHQKADAWLYDLHSPKVTRYAANGTIAEGKAAGICARDWRASRLAEPRDLLENAENP